jgi:outer membrane protein assembly factor BamB
LAKNDDNFSPTEDDSFIIALSVLSEKKQPVTLNEETSPEFRNALYKAYSNEEKKISLRLLTDSPRAGSLFYSGKSFDSSPSNIPRLVINYTLGPPALLETLSWAQHQQNPEHTGRNPWIPFKNPTGFSLEKIEMSKMNGRAGAIVDYPLIHRGDMYLVNNVEENNYLVALDFKGKELWRQAIAEGIVQRSPVISRDGILYVVTENKIAGYDLNASGQRVALYPEKPSEKLSGKLSAYTDLTIGNDGSLFLALKENGVNYLYGFTSHLKPFIKSGPFGKGEEKISTATVSPDGRIIFAQIPKGAVTIDITDPSQEQRIKLGDGKNQPWEYYHVPVAGPAGGIMVFSDFTGTANKANVWGTDTKIIWSRSGTLVPQPVLGSNDLIYFIQGGALQRHNYKKVGSGETPKGKGLNTTSNLVMDGADNIYFWDKGYLHGYQADGEALFAKIPLTSEVNERNVDKKGQKVEGPEQFIRLLLGPDGTLWANNKNGNALYAFKPRYAVSDLTLTQEDLKDVKTQTVYRANGTLTVSSLTVEEGTKILFQAQKGITFPKGQPFAVKKGASLLCRTGF